MKLNLRKKNDESQKIEMQVEIDPRISMLHVEKISKICPKNVFEVTDDENTEGKISVGLGAVIMNKICEIHSAEMTIENNGADQKSGATLKIKFSHLGV